MSLRIDQDHRRFREIVRGKIKQNLRKYITQGEMLGKKGKEVVSIPLPQIDIPHFRFGAKQQGGVGQGDGDPGDPLGGEPQPGTGKAGDRPGEHLLEVDVTMEELAAILGEELRLPRIEPKGKQRIIAKKDRYTGVRNTGPESLRHFRRTFKQALRRQIAMGQYDPKNPLIVPVREDKRYRSWKTEPLPQSNAVIIYMMDVSGSMGDEQKEIVRIESFWIDTWLRSQYQGIESRYIIHDAMAKEVDRETFFRTRESGGTMISSAYKLCSKLMTEEYPSSEWNIYPFHFSDGDNWSVDDTVTCIELLKSQILPHVNLFVTARWSRRTGRVSSSRTYRSTSTRRAT
jgi:uncharacterized sporulation protein YeaH/YhbH (DUF444 family)